MPYNIMDETDIGKLLCKMRNTYTKNVQPMQRLLNIMSGNEQKNWTPRECRSAYEAILAYYIDDEEELEWIRAVSGCSEGYRNLDTATKRRDKFVQYLQSTDSNFRLYGRDNHALSIAESKLLNRIGDKIQEELNEGRGLALFEEFLPSSGDSITQMGTQKPKMISCHAPDGNIRTETPRLTISTLQKEIRITVGEIIQVTAIPLLNNKIISETLKYSVSNPKILDISPNGMLTSVQTSSTEETAEVIIQSNDNTQIKLNVTIIPSKESYKPVIIDPNNFNPTFYIIQKVRVIGGVKEWTDYVNAKVGDTVEFQMEYKNITNGESQDNVSIRDILPSNLEYIPNTTKLWNEFYDGGLVSPDTSLFGNGINIGGYNPGANAYVRFRAKVVDQNLGVGANTLINWSQCGVGKVTIQDYASVLVDKICDRS